MPYDNTGCHSHATFKMGGKSAPGSRCHYNTCDVLKLQGITDSAQTAPFTQGQGNQRGPDTSILVVFFGWEVSWDPFCCVESP